MVDELEDPVVATEEEPEGGGEPETPQLDPAEEQKRKSEEGRIEKENRLREEAEAVTNNLKAQLTTAGYQVDEKGNILTPQAATQQSQVSEIEEDEGPNIFAMSPKQIEAYIDGIADKKATAKVAQALEYVMPMVNEGAEQTLQAAVPDWQAIRGDVETMLKGQGYMNVADAKRRNAAFFEIAVGAARNKVNVATAQGAVPADRGDRLAQAAGIGGGSSRPVAAADDGLDSDEREAARAMGVTPAEYLALVTSAVTTVREPAKKEKGK